MRERGSCAHKTPIKSPSTVQYRIIASIQVYTIQGATVSGMIEREKPYGENGSI
jgi:hypothetical protein